MSSPSLAWGVISTGRIARSLARAIGNVPGASLRAVASRSREKAEAFAREFGAHAAYGSYEELLADAAVQVVYVATPHPQHAEWAIRAAAAGKHVLCEKPMTLNYPDTLAVTRAAEAGGIFLMEAFMYRCHPQTAKVTELIRSGAIGELQFIEASFGFAAEFDPASRLFNAELGGGGILDVGCYPVSFARMAAGAAMGRNFADPVELTGTGRIGPSGTDECAAAVLRFENGIVAQVACGTRVQLANTVLLRGTGGTLLVESPWFCNGRLVLHRHGAPPSEIEVKPGPGLYESEVRVVMAHLEAGEAPQMSRADSLGNARALDAWRTGLGLVYPQEKPA